ncbi:MAG: pyrroline-5-carboxylate reductase [Bacteroidetes bacterium]|nr:pyrroline-5-carboxylate reductase [Bacteroidota bacterium]HET6243958.1 pyrroline-5-carboxylate reductase [Bacteroidia bacterium]
MTTKNIAIIGAGNIGISLAKGLVSSGKFNANHIALVKRNTATIAEFTKMGYLVSNNIEHAISKADIIVLAVLPQQLDTMLKELKDYTVPEKHLIVSVVSGAPISGISGFLNPEIQIIRAMPNTAIAIGESMTCIASGNANAENMAYVKAMFNAVGETIEIKEELMTSATALCACGIAFFLRAIRAASQGGIELGFHADEALKMATQTAKGAASLLKISGGHPENEIDKVTSPKGCTIAGLNEMEYKGFSAAMIKGIKVSAKKAGELY